MMSENIAEQPAGISRFAAMKYRLATAGLFVMSFVGMAAAAEINLSAITEMIDAMVGIIPSLVDLMVAVIPLIFLGMMISFIVGLLAAILGIIKFNFG